MSPVRPPNVAPPHPTAGAPSLPGALPTDLLGLTRGEFTALAKQILPAGAGVAPELYRLALAHGDLSPDRLGASLNDANAAAWTQAFTVGLLDLRKLVEEPGETGTTAKAVFATPDGYEVETVRIPMKYHEDGRVASWTQCLSSQVGCRMGCAFCETGRMGLIRNLTAAEIVSQVLTARLRLGWQAKNLVFMGMGEALDNWDQLHQALRVLTDGAGLGFGADRITICTAGHAEGIRKLHDLGWKRLNLSISLNGGADELRTRLMPVNRRTPLAELQSLLAGYRQRRNFVLGVNYCLLPGINDSQGDAQRIANFCRPLGRVMVNLIPYNPGTTALARAPEEDEIVRFVGWLREVGLPVRRRITKGRSIMAACGQLGNVALRKNPRPGAGGLSSSEVRTV